ncbi:putative RING/U-box superfamily protein [Tripterygium wilfordii]|uniref:Putative RING/U-box superfamily protein n=1 Tax=Tripterygium wilfordii TaxID=458696 RepID=A0A7J7C616_TRIWF|nr:E3 ubiquitin-protein ligase Os04g0590900-like [Tripterygium wilfordii]KAF5729584.1 putative RING/U-box superfamily protein [Tripterygium wilfordii]
MAEENNSKLTVALIGFASAALVFSLYHLISESSCFTRPSGPSRREPRPSMAQNMEAPNSTESSMAELIPAHKYYKGVGLVAHDGMCAVCLSEFEDGEDLRTLPECLHSYHVECIDMWLSSHSSCPMCRTDAVPSPLSHEPRFGYTDLVAMNQNLVILQSGVVQSVSRTPRL